MITVTFKGLWARKRRLVGTLIAVFLGVSFLAGALALSDTLGANFNTLFANANAGTDAVVRSTTALGSGPRAPRTLIPASLVPQVGAVDGVADAQPSITGDGQLIGADGKAIGGIGPPRIAANWVPDPALNPYRLVSGRAPQSDNEVVINQGAAKTGKLALGQTTTVETPQPVTVRIVGIATFGTADGFGPATYTAFSLAGAERYISGRPGQVTSISVKAAPGVSQDTVVNRIQAALPAGVEAITGAQLTQDNIDNINSSFLDTLRIFLLVFAGIALLVATFSISNTFSILTAQRTREAALLRAIGASRRQILASVVVEALIVGTVASALGVLGGLAIAGLLKGLFDSFGFALPAGGLTVTAGSVITALVVGVLVTVAAGLSPAVRASRTPPLAALRETTTQVAPTSRRRVAGLALAAVGIAVILVGLTGSGNGVLAPVGLGAVAVLVGMVVLGPVVARPASAAIGWPAARVRGLPGVLARGNAMRNPRRTSAAATALMVGVAVVTLFTVLAASLKTSMNNGVAGSFQGDLAITPGGFGGGGGGGGGLSPQLAAAAAQLPQVQVATGLGTGSGRGDDALIAGHSQNLSVVDPSQIGTVLDLHTVGGSVSGLGANQLAVSQREADNKHWRLGTPLSVTFPDGTNSSLAVGAIYQSRDLAGDYVLPQAAWSSHAVQTVDSAILVKLRPGVSTAAGETALRQVATSYGSPTVQDRQAFVTSAGGAINTVLGIVYVMLALAIVIALFGIANTLSLSIFERTRELGLLRVLGETRQQLRATLRWESAIIALFGTVGGLGLGVFLGWALADAMNIAQGIATFTAPPAQLLVILLVGGLAGIVAALRPARRAARLPMLAAIATE
ncbi:MAG TPA: FtsX-like permease family protein [Acidimicrobiales bacterium]